MAAVPTVADCMETAPQAIEAEEPLPKALRLMRERDIRHLPVTRRGTLVGVLSTRDLSLTTPLAQAPPAAISVDDVMTRNPYTVTPTTPLSVVAREMAHRRIGSAVVVDGGRIVGIFTTVDALLVLADILERKQT